MKRGRGRGFTLIELLISIVLMMILLGAVTMIFIKTTDTVARQDARMTVYTNARYAMDIMENDVMGAMTVELPPPPPAAAPIPGQPPPPPPPPPTPMQSLWMENGYCAASGVSPSYNVGGASTHIEKAGDRMSFRTTSAVAQTMQTCEVTYELIPGNKCLDASGALQSGDESHRETARTKRGLFTLVRRVRTIDPAKPAPKAGDPLVYDMIPKVKDLAPPFGLVAVQDTELCHYVVSFNLEYLANNQMFSQLDPSPFPKGDPLGDNKGANDTTTPYRIPAIRVTLVIVEDIAERQERTIQKVMWLPSN